MDKHKKNIGVTAELPAEQPDKVYGGVAVVDGQRTANPNDTRLFLSLDSGLGGHSALQPGDAFLAMPLFRQHESLVRRQSGSVVRCGLRLPKSGSSQRQNHQKSGRVEEIEH